MGIAIGSPSQIERPATRTMVLAINAIVMSLRAARLTTNPPRQAIKNAKNAALPHWPGDTHTWSVNRIIETMAKFVGLNKCLPFTRTTNLLAIAIAGAATASASEFVRNSRHSDSPDIHALRG